MRYTWIVAESAYIERHLQICMYIYVCINFIYKMENCYSLTSLEQLRAICNNICKVNCNMQIGQDELLSECQVINQSSKRQLVIIQLNYLHRHTRIHMCECVCVCVFCKAAH